MDDRKHTSLWLDTVSPEPIEPQDPTRTADDIVIGAGLTGLTTALLLARVGRAVIVLEARSIGAVTTGNTTAKISLLQGTRLSDILGHHSVTVASAYLEANDAGKSWLQGYCGEHGVAVQARDAVSYAATTAGLAAVEREYAACRRLGLDVERVERLDVPFPHAGAVRLADQAQVDPMEVLRALAADLLNQGARIYEGVRALGVSAEVPCRVRTGLGTFTAENVILATGVPFLDRGLYFAKVTPERSYAVAFDVPDLHPTDMFLSVDRPTRSVRTAPTRGGEKLLVGGSGHVVGRTSSAQAHADTLEQWARQYWPGAIATHQWSAQDYATHDHIPFIGSMPRGRGHVQVATGYGKWGMTNAVAAGLRMSAQILGNPPSWAKTIGRRVTSPAVAARGLLSNADTGVKLATGWAGAFLAAGASASPAEGQGITGRDRLRPVAVSTVDDISCRLSAVCSHLGGIVRWNDAEKSWDCPLHGSRFAADGSVLEGPATTPLSRLD